MTAPNEPQRQTTPDPVWSSVRHSAYGAHVRDEARAALRVVADWIDAERPGSPGTWIVEALREEVSRG